MAFVRTARRKTAPALAEVGREPFTALGRADFAWEHPVGELRVAAFGAADRREGPSLSAALRALEFPEDLPQMPGPWFGAAAFGPRLGPDWSGFSPLRFALPALLAWSERGRHFLAAFGEAADERLRAALSAVPLAKAPPAPAMRDVRIVERDGERQAWNALVERALRSIEQGGLDKVVIARAIDLEADGPIDASALLSALSSRHRSCRNFLLQGGDGAAFVGATPEVLCRIADGRVQAEALAGSAAPGQEQALLASGKDLREHRWVVEHVAAALSSVGESVQRRMEPELRELANVVHLHTPISARLAQGRGVADVVAALHPTPAVAGVPQAAALRFIAEHERLDRGLYAGLVGWVGPGRAEIAVALRSALLRGRRARIFVGAGIVQGSTTASEWEETEIKARALLHALGVRP